jgi:hypothetical protein
MWPFYVPLSPHFNMQDAGTKRHSKGPISRYADLFIETWNFAVKEGRILFTDIIAYGKSEEYIKGVELLLYSFFHHIKSYNLISSVDE